MSLREAASVVFGLVAVAADPALRLPALRAATAAERRRAARAGLRGRRSRCSASSSSAGWSDQIARWPQGFLEPAEAKPETLRRVERARRGPGFGQVTEIGQVTRRVLPHARRSARRDPAARGSRVQARHAQRDRRAGRAHSTHPGPARPRVPVHDARGARHGRLDHDPRPGAHTLRSWPPRGGSRTTWRRTSRLQVGEGVAGKVAQMGEPCSWTTSRRIRVPRPSLQYGATAPSSACRSARATG